MFQRIVVKKIKTNVFLSKNFIAENRVFYETVWKNIVETGRPQMTMQYDACALHCGYLRQHTRTQNMQYFFLFQATTAKSVRLNVAFILTLSVLSLRPSVRFAFLKTDSGPNIRVCNSTVITEILNLVTNT